MPGLGVIVGRVHEWIHEALALRQGSKGSRVTKEGHQGAQRTEEKTKSDNGAQSQDKAHALDTWLEASARRQGSSW